MRAGKSILLCRRAEGPSSSTNALDVCLINLWFELSLSRTELTHVVDIIVSGSDATKHNLAQGCV